MNCNAKDAIGILFFFVVDSRSIETHCIHKRAKMQKSTNKKKTKKYILVNKNDDDDDDGDDRKIKCLRENIVQWIATWNFLLFVFFFLFQFF